MDNLNKDIYNKYFNIVFKYCLKLTEDTYAAEDITQETFYKAINNINKFKGNSSILTWLCAIAKNIYYTEYKKNKRVIFFDEIDYSNLKSEENLEETIISKDEKALMNYLISILDENTQKVILLRIKEELSFREIGLIMNKSENWARVTFYRGKRKMERSGKDEQE